MIKKEKQVLKVSKIKITWTMMKPPPFPFCFPKFETFKEGVGEVHWELYLPMKQDGFEFAFQTADLHL